MSLQQQEYFSLSTRRHVFEGVAFGLQQATLFCQVTVASLSDQQLAHLDTHFDLFLKENAPELAPDCDNAERFVRRLIFWQSAIQRQSGIPVSERYWISPEPESAADTRVFTTAIPVVRGKASLRALTWVKSAVNEAFSKYASQQPDEEELQQTLDRINIELNNYSEPGINQHLIIMAANRLDIPVTRMSRRVILLGTGRYTRWFESTITDKTSPIGANIARNKEFTASLLRLMGLPGARQIRVSSAEEATEAAVRLGYPVVVKPADQDRGIGVNADLRNEASVIGAYQEARAASDHILVEKFCNGFTHRLTVVEDEVVRVTRRIAGGVVGDGKHSVAELVTLWNQDEENQRRSRRLGKVLLSLDAEARDLLAQQEVDESFIPEAEQYIRLRRRDNINTGGTNEHLQPDAIHPDNLRLAIDAARILGLDCAGVDLIIDDIQKSWQETEALICELNAKPQMGDSRNENIYDRVLNRLMGGNYRVPARLVICPNAVIDQGSLAAELSRQSEHVGVSSRNGIWAGGQQITAKFADGYRAARALLVRSEIHRAVCLMTPAEIADKGLPSNRWDEAQIYYPQKLDKDEQVLMGRVKNIITGHVDDSLAAAKAPVSPAQESVIT